MILKSSMTGETEDPCLRPPLSLQLSPAWYRAKKPFRFPLPSKEKKWLLDEGSLTKRLVSCCQGHFWVQVMGQQMCVPLYDERMALGMHRAETAWIREVYLYCDTIRWVYARTIIPMGTLHGGGRRLTGLGDRPLGALLFADPRAGRESMEVTALHNRHALYYKALGVRKDGPSMIWARRTQFRYFGSPLLVHEVFLPELLEDFSSTGENSALIHPCP